MSQFDDRSVRRELFGILIDTDIELPSEDMEDLMDEIMQVTEDVYYKGYERGKLANEVVLREIEVDVEKEFEDLTLLEDMDLFPSEPE